MVDLKQQYLKIKNEIDAAVAGVLDSTVFIGGPQVNELSKNLAEYLGVKHVIPCANGTDALQIAMMALGLQPGDEVITSTYSFFATAGVGLTSQYVEQIGRKLLGGLLGADPAAEAAAPAAPAAPRKVRREMSMARSLLQFANLQIPNPHGVRVVLEDDVAHLAGDVVGIVVPLALRECSGHRGRARRPFRRSRGPPRGCRRRGRSPW